MKLKLLIPALLAASPAFAHEAPAAHVHPHADWSLTSVTVLAIAAMAVIYQVLRNNRDRK